MSTRAGPRAGQRVAWCLLLSEEVTFPLRAIPSSSIPRSVVNPEEWVRDQGIVLQSAHGPIPNLAEYVAGEPIRGSWWGHKSSHLIFNVLNQVRDSPDVVALRLFNGKITLIHRRVWPALVRVADRFPVASLAAIEEQHTASGAHITIEIPYPEWVPAEDAAAAAQLSVEEALAQLPACLL
jgi:hypothetical protein